MGGATRMTLTTTVMVMETTGELLFFVEIFEKERRGRRRGRRRRTHLFFFSISFSEFFNNNNNKKGALQLIVPLIVAVFCAKVTGDALGVDGIDDTHLKLRGAPVLDEPALTARQKMVADKLTVGELAAAPVVALPPVVAAGRLLEVLASCSHSAFPVTPDAGASGGGGGMEGGRTGIGGTSASGLNGGGAADSDFGGSNEAAAAAADSVVAGPFAAHGLIRRDVALKLLEHRLGFVGGGGSSGGSNGAGSAATAPGTSPSSSLVPRTQAGREAVLCLLEQRPVKSRREAALLSAAAAVRSRSDLAALVDLRPFMQRHPHVIAADASLSRAYRLFRTLGLRHLLVAPPRPQAVGLITRKDICEANARLALGRKANAGLATASARLTRAGLPFIPYDPYDPTVGGGGGGDAGLHNLGSELGGGGGSSSGMGMQRLSSGGLVVGGGGGGAGAVGSLSFGAASSSLGLEAAGGGGGGGSGFAGEARRRGGGGSASPSLDRGAGSDDASASAAGVEMSALLGGGGGIGGNV